MHFSLPCMPIVSGRFQALGGFCGHLRIYSGRKREVLPAKLKSFPMAQIKIKIERIGTINN